MHDANVKTIIDTPLKVRVKTNAVFLLYFDFVRPIISQRMHLMLDNFWLR
jgi:hypothetical protein